MNPFNRLLLLVAFLSISSMSINAQKRAGTPLPERSHVRGNTNTNTGKNQDQTNSYSYHIIDAAYNTFGYDILINRKVTIHQTTIPGRSGLKGFSSKKDAAIVAELVIKKIKEGQMPPTITSQELNKIIQTN